MISEGFENAQLLVNYVHGALPSTTEILDVTEWLHIVTLMPHWPGAAAVDMWFGHSPYYTVWLFN